MTIRRGTALAMISALLLTLTAAAGCGGDDDEVTEKKKVKLVDGTFVGTVKGTKAFVAVVASPAPKGKRRRDVTVFACDAKSLCEWLSGSATENSFTATSGDDAKAKGKLTSKAASGSIELPGGRMVKYVARPAAATAGLYNLTVSSKGKLTGASAAGVGLTGKSTLPGPGPGTLKLADGTRLKFDATENASGEAIRLPAGDVRVIVLPGRQLTGAGKSKGGEGGASDFFVRSPSS